MVDVIMMQMMTFIIKYMFHISDDMSLWAYFSDPALRARLIKGLIVTGIIIGLILYSSTEIQEMTVFNKDVIFTTLHHWGPYAWVIYIIILIIAVMSPLPDSLVIIAGGFLFGSLIGTILTIIGQSLGAIIDFLLARTLGRNFVLKKFPKSVHLIDQYAQSLGWQTVFVMRLFPTLSFDMLSYIAGVSNLSLRSYSIATITGLIPLAIMTTILGASMSIHSGGLAIISVVGGSILIMAIYSVFHMYVQRKKILP